MGRYKLKFPRICVAVVAGTVRELRMQMEKAAVNADLIELRLDQLHASELDDLA